MSEENKKVLPVVVIYLSFYDGGLTVAFGAYSFLDDRLTNAERIELSKHLESASRVILQSLVRTLTD